MLRMPRWINAVIPAAGRSRRMGTHKLLLEIDGETVISRLVRALDEACVSRIHILVRIDDHALLDELEPLPVTVVTTETDTADMKASVGAILKAIQEQVIPDDLDAWLLMPADHPVVDPQIVIRLIDAGEEDRTSIVVPTFETRRGHPVLFPWKLAAAVQNIPADRGIDWLVSTEEANVVEVPVETDSIHWDLDTPEDVERLKKWLNSQRMQ